MCDVVTGTIRPSAIKPSVREGETVRNLEVMKFNDSMKPACRLLNGDSRLPLEPSVRHPPVAASFTPSFRQRKPAEKGTKKSNGFVAMDRLTLTPIVPSAESQKYASKYELFQADDV